MNPTFAPHATFTHRPVIDILTGAPIHGLARLSAEKKPETVPAGAPFALSPPVLFQLQEQALAQGQDSLLRTFTLPDAQLHPGTVNVFGLEVSGLGQAQSRGVDGHKKGPIPPLGWRGENGFNFTAGVNLGAPGAALHVRDSLHEGLDVALQGDGVEEPNGINGDVDAGGRLLALANEVVKPGGHLVIGDLIGRTIVKARQSSHVAAVGLLSAQCSTSDGEVPNVFGS